MKAKLKLREETKRALYEMQTQLRGENPALLVVSNDDEKAFRTARNRIVHYGFSPQDDEECTVLLLKTGLPYLSLCYKQFFDFYLDWRDIPPLRSSFSAATFSEGEATKVGLEPELARQLRLALTGYNRVKHDDKATKRFCFAAVEHYVLLGLKHGTMSESDRIALSDGDITWPVEEKAKERLERVREPSGRFDCPVCYEPKGVVAELDDEKLRHSIVETGRCACAMCGFALGHSSSYMSAVLLEDQITARGAEILFGYGSG